MVEDKILVGPVFTSELKRIGEKRYIIIHSKGSTSLVPNIFRMFTSTQIDGHFHKCIDDEVFKD